MDFISSSLTTRPTEDFYVFNYPKLPCAPVRNRRQRAFELFISSGPLNIWNENDYHLMLTEGLAETQKFSTSMLKVHHPPLTAIGKATSVFDLLKRKENSKPMKQWSGEEVCVWLCEEANKFDCEYENIEVKNFHNVKGSKLIEMTEQEFIAKDQQYGSFLFKIVDRHKKSENIQKEVQTLKNIKPQNENIHNNKKSGIHKVRFPKEKNKRKKCGYVWEFIRDLLLNPEYSPSIICWERYEEGTFRFVQSKKAAELWGRKKNNPKMNFENFSRAIRQNYKSQYLRQIKKRLIYGFGPKATGWQTDNPNFQDRTK